MCTFPASSRPDGRLSGPLHNNRTRSHSSTKRDHKHFVAIFQLSFLINLVKSNRDGSSRGIAILINSNNNLFHRYTQFLSSRLNDSEVCLVRNEPINTLKGNICFLKNFL